MTATARRDESPPIQVYAPHKVGLPDMRQYVRDLLARREFAVELSRATMRAGYSVTFFGRLWLVLNPLLLALVYYILVDLLSNRSGGDFLVHLVGSLFFFYFISGCLTSGAGSVTGGGKLIATMAFPRLLMPLSAVRSAFFRFLPTMVVYAVFHLGFQQPLRWQMLLAAVFLLLATIFGIGVASIFATLQVYFRDTASFLPYFVRIWLYLSPVLWYPEDAVRHLGRTGAHFALINPLHSLIGGWTDLLVRGVVPPASVWLAATAWSVLAFVVGTLFFISREREFAVRL